MRVIEVYRSDPERPLKDPLPEKDGFVFRLLKGDVCDPWMDSDGWFGPGKPFYTIRFWSYLPLPFFAWKIWGWAGYIGAKAYGADSEHYKGWIPDEDIFPGSNALCFSFRPFASS